MAGMGKWLGTVPPGGARAAMLQSLASGGIAAPGGGEDNGEENGDDIFITLPVENRLAIIAPHNNASTTAQDKITEIGTPEGLLKQEDNDKRPTKKENAKNDRASAEFDGVDDVMTGDALAGVGAGQEFTVSILFKTNEIGEVQTLISNVLGADDRFILQILASGHLSAGVWDGSWEAASSDAALEADVWYLAVVEYDGSQITLSIDYLLQSGTTAPSSSSDTVGLSYGGDTGGGTNLDGETVTAFIYAETELEDVLVGWYHDVYGAVEMLAVDTFDSYDAEVSVAGLNAGFGWDGGWVDHSLKGFPASRDTFDSYDDTTDMDGLDGGVGWVLPVAPPEVDDGSGWDGGWKDYTLEE